MKTLILVSLTLFLVIPMSAPSQSWDRVTLGKLAQDSIHAHVVGGFSGSVLIASDDRDFLINEGYGYTDSTRAYPIDRHTLFHVASVTKTFTAVLTMKLVEQGRISLKDSLGKLLSHVPRDKQGITVHQLLTHTSGFQQHYVNQEVQTHDTAIVHLLGDSLKFVPGSEFLYSNENYEMLAAIIETVTGRKFEDLLRREILVPCGMKETSFWGEFDDLDAKHVAQKLKELPNSTRARNWDFLGSGGIWTTPSDLFRFYHAFKANVFLSPRATQDMLKEYQKLNSTSVGYGWFISTSPRHEYWTRGAEDFGHNAVLRWFPDDHNLVVIVFADTGERGGKKETDNRLVSDAIVAAIFNNTPK